MVILLIAVVLFGGSRVAGLGKALGTSLREFRAELNKGTENKDETAGTVIAEK